MIDLDKREVRLRGDLDEFVFKLCLKVQNPPASDPTFMAAANELLLIGIEELYQTIFANNSPTLNAVSMFSWKVERAVHEVLAERIRNIFSTSLGVIIKHNAEALEIDLTRDYRPSSFEVVIFLLIKVDLLSQPPKHQGLDLISHLTAPKPVNLTFNEAMKLAK